MGTWYTGDVPKADLIMYSNSMLFCIVLLHRIYRTIQNTGKQELWGNIIEHIFF